MRKSAPKRQITIYDIADRAGTSASTVGAVLNGSWRARRISAERAETIQRIADEMGYAPNMQARALRSERSRMIGMILPMYENRYFGAIAEQFERGARARGLLPMTSCTRREPELELATVRQMLAYNIERIICTGATDPDGIARLCATQNVPTINLDLPGTEAPSIISDNHLGAYKLTQALIKRAEADALHWQDSLLFIGGRASDHNTSERIRGFRHAVLDAQAEPQEANIVACGYAASKSKAAFAAHVQRTGQIPDVVFVNSTISLEGILQWLGETQPRALETTVFGSFDWDPFATYAAKKLYSVRQDVDAMVAAMFQIIDADQAPANVLTQIEPVVLT